MDQSRGTGQLEWMRGADGGRAPAPPALIEFTRVGHTYRSLLGRDIPAVEDFSLTIGAGEIVGIAGPNGAGKSTLIGILLGYVHPTRGNASIAGLAPRTYVERHGIGYLSELIAIPPRWVVQHALQRYAILAAIAPDRVRARVAEVVDQLGLGDQTGKRVKQLSKGNLQRVGLAQALLRDERVLILDEPTHGLDPLWTQRFRDIVETLRRPDRAILIASHNLDELQRLADRVAIIDRGRLQTVVEPRSVRNASTTAYVLTVVGDAAAVSAVFPGAREVARGEFALDAIDLSALNAGVAALIARGVLLSSLRPAHSVLEQHFREAVRE